MAPREKPDYGKEEADKIYTHTLQMKFMSQDDLDVFVSRYLNSGEQDTGCYTTQVSEDGTYLTNQSYDWKEPALYVDVEDYE
jgi:hypothetical protein